MWKDSTIIEGYYTLRDLVNNGYARKRELKQYYYDHIEVMERNNVSKLFKD